jgi:pyridoxal biosynthesis lyase PdxS
MEPSLPAIHDEDLSRQAPYMRYLVGQRLEEIWQVCQPHLDGTAARPDHRYVETATKVLVHMSRLYRLDAPSVAAPAETTPADAAMMVEGRLKELEARLRPAPEG